MAHTSRARVLCHLKEGEYWAAVVAAGASRLHACMYTKRNLNARL